MFQPWKTEAVKIQCCKSIQWYVAVPTSEANLRSYEKSHCDLQSAQWHHSACHFRERNKNAVSTDEWAIFSIKNWWQLDEASARSGEQCKAEPDAASELVHKRCNNEVQLRRCYYSQVQLWSNLYTLTPRSVRKQFHSFNNNNIGRNNNNESESRAAAQQEGSIRRVPTLLTRH